MAGAAVRASFDFTLAGPTRTLDGALRRRKTALLLARLTFVATAWLLDTIPKGFSRGKTSAR